MSWIFFLLILYFIYKQLSKSARKAKRQRRDQRPVPYPGEDTYRDDDAYGDGYPYPTETVKTDSYDRRYWEGPYEKENDPYEVVTGGGKTKVTLELPERMASESIREKAQPELWPKRMNRQLKLKKRLVLRRYNGRHSRHGCHAIACRQALSGRKFGRLPWLAAGGCVDD